MFKKLLESYAPYQSVAALHFSSKSHVTKDYISVDEDTFKKRVKQMVKACNDIVAKIV
jgi:hypothetical protein